MEMIAFAQFIITWGVWSNGAQFQRDDMPWKKGNSEYGIGIYTFMDSIHMQSYIYIYIYHRMYAQSIKIKYL